MAKNDSDDKLNTVTISNEKDFNRPATAVALSIISELNISLYDLIET